MGRLQKTRDFSSIHSVLKHWLLLLITMHLVWKPDAKLTPFELPNMYMYTWHEFKGSELRRKKDKTLCFYIFVNENDTNQTWNVLVRFDEFWQCFTQARTSRMITEINGLIESKIGKKGGTTVLPNWPTDERGPLYALAIIEETIRTYGRRNVSSSVMLITNRLHCTMNSTKCFAHEK